MRSACVEGQDVADKRDPAPCGTTANAASLNCVQWRHS